MTIELEATMHGPEGRRTATATAADYEAAKAQLEGQVLEGEKLLYFRRLSD